MFAELAALGFISTATFLLTHPGGQYFKQALNCLAALFGTDFGHMCVCVRVRVRVRVWSGLMH